MKAIEHPGQTVLRKEHAAQIEHEGVAVVVAPAVVPFDEGEHLTAVTINIVNQSHRTVRLALDDVVLIGGDGMRRGPVDPQRFERYARMAQGDGPPFRPHPRYRVYVGVGYGGWHYPCGPYGGYDPWWPDDYWDEYDAMRDYYYQRERMARFATGLWRTRVVEPGYVAGGHVVFDYKLRRKEQVVVEVVIQRPAGTQPARGPTTLPLEPTTTGPMRLRFHFKT